jgi:hypothetical protein
LSLRTSGRTGCRSSACSSPKESASLFEEVALGEELVEYVTRPGYEPLA